MNRCKGFPRLALPKTVGLGRLVVALMLVAVANNAYAAMTINQLEQQGGVKLNAWLSDGTDVSEPAAVTQQVIMVIEVATPRWFTGGTRISAFGLPELIVKQRNPFATNYTRREKGQTWSYQHWEVTLYPQQSGEYQLPKVAVKVQVSAPDGSNVSGTLYTEPMSLFTYLPDATLTQQQAWFAASNVNVQQSWDSSSDSLQAGDTISRRITVSADDTLSILLPPTNQLSDALIGLKAYPKPSELLDSQSRGDYQAKRVDETVYLLAQGGDFTLPAQTVTWWDTDSQQIKTVELAEKTIHVAHTLRSLTTQYWQQIVFVGFGLIVAIATLLAVLRYYRHRPKPQVWQLLRQVSQSNWPQVRTLIYRRVRTRANTRQLKQVSFSDTGEQTAWQDHSHRIQNQTPTAKQSLWLWRRIKQRKSLKNKRILKQLEQWRPSINGDVEIGGE
ncbi:hypothetical protein [Vibrio hippocampi]|uniref:Protein BatD n=1 Tax=Vibrio hippocampi TaxID=654686 RepID=A0ABN8DM17_9VIBR|nr:hypothetical protein [Vibrio hippocampi]CAH0529650.1 hypothetical protein VHP8226_03405 [Vibrio hippocampi]